MKGLRGVIGRVRDWRRGWHERSKLQRIDLYTRVTLCAMVWLFLLTWGFLPLGTVFGRGSWALAIGATLLTVNVAQCLLSTFNVGPAFDHYRGAAPFPGGGCGSLRCCWWCCPGC
ncbi:two-component system, NarL family, sensor histidine kinase DesK [Streptomyces sp. Ncost-T6T-2b]|nr:two-component system, NarL family, sensor histidine kinase DesK [Streptomyces sp. Ncost-T6T-2b]